MTLVTFDTQFARLERIATTVAVVAIGATMLVIVADVLMRYVFLRPFAWSYQLVQYVLLVAIYFLAISETQRRRENIAVHALERFLGPRARALMDAAVSLLILIFAVTLLWVGWVALDKAVTRGEFAPGLINWPKWPSYAMFVFGTAMLVVRLVLDTLLALGGHRDGAHDLADAA